VRGLTRAAGTGAERSLAPVGSAAIPFPKIADLTISRITHVPMSGHHIRDG